MKKKGVLNNEKGASLSFVLIIGMIILLMVTSLLMVANGSFTFTQETLESRQGYLDAKSVIEFGKIEINNRMDRIKGGTLVDSGSFEIYAVINSVTGNIDYQSLSLSPTGRVSVGVCEIDRTIENPTTTKYLYKIETQNLRRKLDFECSFNYAKSPGDVPEDKSASWTTTKINKKNNSTLQCIIGGTVKGTYYSSELSVSEPDSDLKIDEFKWIKTKDLDLAARNICFDVTPPSDGDSTNNSVFNIEAAEELRFKTSYTLNNTKTNTLKAKNVIIQGDLVLGNYSDLIITCENLWVTGNITLGENSELTVISKPNDPIKPSNLMIVGGQIIGRGKNNSGDARIDISNLDYFKCNGIDVYDCNFFSLTSKTVIINGDFKMVRTDGNNNAITTQYFDCSGLTTMLDAHKDKLYFKPMDGTLNMRFAGGYSQSKSDVIIDGADMVVFGKSFNLADAASVELIVKADRVYFDINPEETNYIRDNCTFDYKKNKMRTQVNVKSATTGRVIPVGNYTATDDSEELKKDNLKLDSSTYTAPIWPPEPAPTGKGGIDSITTAYY